MSGNNHHKLEKILSQNYVYIKHPDKLREKIQKLVKDGSAHLQVISDFDKTISKFKHLNRRIPSSHHIIESHSTMPEDIKKEFVEMQHKYYAIETDHKLAVPQKTPHMVEWWESGSELMIKAKVKKEYLPEMVKEAHMYLRDGFTNLAQRLCDSKIPLLVFSAGLGDVLEEIIRQQSHIFPNMKIVANYMDFDQDGFLVGFKGDIIHTFNKNELVLKGDETWEEEAKGRHNVILMGDMMGDLTMADGVKDLDVCLKIAFLNSNFENLLDEFMESWDIVLEDDQTMDIPNAILDAILS